MATVLLVHGAFHGPWCWDDLARRLTDQGHRVRTVQLRGHDQRAGRIWYRIRDYVEDVRRAVVELDEPVVLVGHSFGGLVVQKYLERGEAAGAVLMASVPTRGTFLPVCRLGLHHPLLLLKINLLLTLRPLISNPEIVREYFFSPDTSRQTVDQCLARLQDESYPAFLGTIFVLPKPRRITVPVLVLGAELDRFFTVAEVRRTAAAYRTDAQILPATGHNLMLEATWPDVADRINHWLHAGGQGGR
jgi:pimeloyl-ACP methyl ester carboxylesterase